jgi:hypothetical protein
VGVAAIPPRLIHPQDLGLRDAGRAALDRVRVASDPGRQKTAEGEHPQSHHGHLQGARTTAVPAPGRRPVEQDGPKVGSHRIGVRVTLRGVLGE